LSSELLVLEKETIMFRKLTIASMLMIAFAISAAAQGKTDFTGTWKLKVDKSDFGMMPAPASRTDKIEQTAAGIKDTVDVRSAQQGKQAYTINYTTDGKEVVNNVGGRDIKSTATWDGALLVISSKFKFQDSDVDAKSNWSLSDGGKTLTLMHHYTSSMGEMDQKLVFEKQEATTAAKP
jgi:hypothetical protein